MTEYIKDQALFFACILGPWVFIALFNLIKHKVRRKDEK